MNKIVLSTFAVLGVSASAFAADSGDILLGFKSTNVADLSSSTFNVANVTTLANQAAGTTVFLTNVDSVLDSTFGTAWNTRSDIQWGVLGNVRAADGYSDQYGAQNNPFVASRTVAYANSSTSGWGTQGGKWAGVASMVGGVGTNSTLLNTNTFSWKSNYGTTSLAFGKYTKTSATTGAFDNSTNFTSVSEYTTQLYKYISTDAADASGIPLPGQGTVTFLGTFTLASNGDFSFTAAGAPIPEPSTYAALLGGAALAFAALRRRQAAVA